MKRNLLVAVLAFSLSSAAFAQSNANLDSTNTSNTSSTSAAQNAGNAQSINFNSNSDGKSTLRSAPSLAAPGFTGSFSQDNCVTQDGAGVSVVGFAAYAAAGSDRISCVNLRVYERLQQGASSEQNIGNVQKASAMRQAAQDMLCLINDVTRLVLQAQGLCTKAVIENYEANFNGAKRTSSTTPAQQETFPVNYYN